MQQILNTVREAIHAREKQIADYTCKREEAIKMLCHYDARIEKEKSVIIQLNSELNKLENNISELHHLKFGHERGTTNCAATTNGPGNCNATQASGRGPVFHEQNDAVDTHYKKT